MNQFLFPFLGILGAAIGFSVGGILNTTLDAISRKLLVPYKVFVIPHRKLFIKLATVVVTAVLFGYCNNKVCLLASLLFCWGLLMLCFIDIENQILPDEITQPLLWLGLFFNIFNVFSDLRSAVLGAILGYLFFAVTAYLMHSIKKIESLGRGDFKLLGVLGAWFGWQQLPATIFLASFLGLIIGGVYLATTKKIISTRIPFGPFISISGFVMVLWHQEIMNFVERQF